MKATPSFQEEKDLLELFTEAINDMKNAPECVKSGSVEFGFRDEFFVTIIVERKRK